jgi:ribosomal protein L34E
MFTRIFGKSSSSLTTNSSFTASTTSSSSGSTQSNRAKKKAAKVLCKEIKEELKDIERGRGSRERYNELTKKLNQYGSELNFDAILEFNLLMTVKGSRMGVLESRTDNEIENKIMKTYEIISNIEDALKSESEDEEEEKKP